jgi:hypothetical protein
LDFGWIGKNEKNNNLFIYNKNILILDKTRQYGSTTPNTTRKGGIIRRYVKKISNTSRTS